MSMTVIVVETVEDRFIGFLSSCMLQVGIGVFISSSMNAGVRDRVWSVLEGWHASLQDGKIIMAYKDKNEASGIALRHLGQIKRKVVNIDGIMSVLKNTK
jgi:CRISPR-associated protein Cas2